MKFSPSARSLLVCAAVSVFSGAAFLAIPKAAGKPTLVVEAFISRATSLKISYNDRWSEQYVDAVVPNEWHSYQFPSPRKTASLKLDPSDIAGASIKIASIELLDANGGEQTLAIDRMAGWPRAAWKCNSIRLSIFWK